MDVLGATVHNLYDLSPKQMCSSHLLELIFVLSFKILSCTNKMEIGELKKIDNQLNKLNTQF